MSRTTTEQDAAWRAYQEAGMARNRARTVHEGAVAYGSPSLRYRAAQWLADADRAYREAERAYARARQRSTKELAADPTVWAAIRAEADRLSALDTRTPDELPF